MALSYPAAWIYLVGPVGGAAVAAVAVIAWGRRPVTGKLRHDPAIACYMRCGLPHQASARPGTISQNGPAAVPRDTAVSPRSLTGE
jgi:hypothetical protein